MFLAESTLNELRNNTLIFIPETTKRQFATDTIRIARVMFTPFLGVETLMVRCNPINENREYNASLVFKKVNYREGLGRGIVEVRDTTGRAYYLDRLNSDEQILCRCSCNDFKFRSLIYCKENSSLFGNISKKALENRGITNELRIPILCKHLIKFVNYLDHMIT